MSEAHRRSSVHRPSDVAVVASVDYDIRIFLYSQAAMFSDASPRDASPPNHPLTRVIDQLAHLLPAQGPISIFIHHNTLHAFEHLPFEEAVERAAERLEREPFLAESRYRDKLASGRILARDVVALLDEQLGARGASDVAGVSSRLDLWRAIVLHGIPAA